MGQVTNQTLQEQEEAVTSSHGGQHREAVQQLVDQYCKVWGRLLAFGKPIQ